MSNVNKRKLQKVVRDYHYLGCAEKQTLLKISKKIPEKCCYFCQTDSNDDRICGELKQYEKLNIISHYFCLLFSDNLRDQLEDMSVGFCGFKVKGVVKEIISSRSRICCFCLKNGANLNCIDFSCSHSFHVGCARNNGALLQFFGNFNKFCHKHNRIPRHQPLLRKRWPSFFGYSTLQCGICKFYTTSRPSPSTFRSPCCKFAYFHAECVHKLAASFGRYNFRCPMCNNQDKFLNYAEKRGVYIPIRDASWELDGENRFAEFTVQHTCAYKRCLIEKVEDDDHPGTSTSNFIESEEKIELRKECMALKNANFLSVCRMCGSMAIHMACYRFVDLEVRQLKRWACPICETSKYSSIDDFKIPQKFIKLSQLPELVVNTMEILIDEEDENSQSSQIEKESSQDMSVDLDMSQLSDEVEVEIGNNLTKATFFEQEPSTSTQDAKVAFFDETEKLTTKIPISIDGVKEEDEYGNNNKKGKKMTEIRPPLRQMNGPIDKFLIVTPPSSKSGEKSADFPVEEDDDDDDMEIVYTKIKGVENAFAKKSIAN